MEDALQITLTPEDRAAIDAVEAVMRKYRTGPVTALSFNCAEYGFLVYAHDEYVAFSSDGARGRPLADCIEDALNRVHAANPDEETRKAKRIAELREQLSRLEGEAA